MDTSTTAAVATSVLGETVRCFDEHDALLIETGRYGVRIAYTSGLVPPGDGDITHLECCIDFQDRQMWVGDLRVASSLRSKGIGRQLVKAAERIALVLGLRTVKVFPLASAERFWNKMGYRSYPKTARVVTKDLAKESYAEKPGGAEANLHAFDMIGTYVGVLRWRSQGK